MPFAFVDLDLLDENIRQIPKRAGDKKIRIASKSLRCVHLLRYIFEQNSQYQGVMCFTIPEALYLASLGFDDLLLGYPAWDAEQINQVCAAVGAGKSITLMVDSVAHIRQINTIAAKVGVEAPLCLDVDMSLDLPGLHFGVWRSPVKSAQEALRVYEEIQRSPHVRLEGVMGYEAQIAGVTDNDPRQGLKNQVIRRLKSRSINQIAQRRAAVIKALESAGATLRFVNGGGTGSLESTRLESAVTEVTAGSGFYASGLFDHYRNFKHLPAAGFAVEVVRQPAPNLYTCLGGGYIASGSVGIEKQPTPYLPAGVTLMPLEGTGEVQTPIRYTGQPSLALGDPVFFRHSKAGELCERFNTLLLVRDGAIIDEIPTYRGDGYSFL